MDDAAEGVLGLFGLGDGGDDAHGDDGGGAAGEVGLEVGAELELGGWVEGQVVVVSVDAVSPFVSPHHSLRVHFF